MICNNCKCVSKEAKLHEVKFVVSDDNLCPVMGNIYAAGWDIKSRENVTIQPGERIMVTTGVYLEMPNDMFCYVYIRSSMARIGLILVNSPGIIDPDYRGEIKCLLWNTTKEPIVIGKGDRMAQLVFSKKESVKLVNVEKLSDTERGEGGWGSTGKK